MSLYSCTQYTVYDSWSDDGDTRLILSSVPRWDRVIMNALSLVSLVGFSRQRTLRLKLSFLESGPRRLPLKDPLDRPILKI